MLLVKIMPISLYLSTEGMKTMTNPEEAGINYEEALL